MEGEKEEKMRISRRRRNNEGHVLNPYACKEERRGRKGRIYRRGEEEKGRNM